MKNNAYSVSEERINVISHFIGLLASIVALVLLVQKACKHQDILYRISFIIFGLSLIVLYAASTLYHNEKKPKRRQALNVLDHAAIYVLIAGTYTPFSLVTLHGTYGWILFGVSWAAALLGIGFKLFFFGKYSKLSTVLYVAMGWVVIFAIKPLLNHLPPAGLFWLVMGGLFYTVGAVLYSKDQLKYNHAIFHIFVLLGSMCHFISIYFFV